MPALVLFPWLSINETVDLPGLRLTPFEKGRGPRRLPHITYKIISSILAPYHDDKNIRVGSATLMEHDDWLSGTDVPAEHVPRLFDLKHLIAFSMLARRRFTPYRDYCNFDCFELVGQPYNESGIHAFVLQTRMRHGGGSHLWDASSYPIPVLCMSRKRILWKPIFYGA